MKSFLVVLLLICVWSITISAQSGRRAEALPKPPPASADTGSNGSSDSIPISRKRRSLPSLRGGGEIVVDASRNQTQNQTTTPPPENNAPTEGDDEVVRVNTQLVTIPVSIIDRRGNLVADLEQSNFKIFENGQEQEVAYFSTTEQPFTVILMIDVSPSTQFKIDEIHTAAIEFVRQLKENDRVMVIAFDRSTRVLIEPTGDRNQISKAIRRANFGEGTSVYDAVDNVINRRLNKIEGRKAVVLFSDGVDTTSIRSSYEKTVRDSAEIDAAFYTIYYNTFSDMRDQGGSTYPPPSGGGLGGILDIILGGGGQRQGGNRGPSRSDYARGELYLKDLADKTGGRKYDAVTTANLQTAFYNIAEELRREYSLGYYPTEAGESGQRKQIKVRVNRPNLIVRARDSYIVGGTEKQAPSAASAAPQKSKFDTQFTNVGR